MKSMLGAFADYMDKDKWDMEAVGANCKNTGWDDVDDQYRTQQTVADVIRCRFMSVALGIANGWTATKQDRHDTVKMDPEEQNTLRCEVTNVFGHLLRHRYCPDQEHWRRGTEYAFQTFTQMKTTPQGGAPGIEGPVVDGLCTMCGYGHNRKHIEAVDLDIVTWLMNEGKILAGMDKIEEGAECNTKWKEYTVHKMNKHGTGKVDETQIPEIKKDEEKLTKEAVKTIEKVTKVVEQKIQEIAGKHTNSKNAHNKNIRPLRIYGRSSCKPYE
ncbi:hypothetical protein AK88_02178 [Plasmodium fragile]|uniref:Schizont-infected cell agglutination extracellular alpha domain-containing protein n=1 Tax=Plasmodium fragile TaxID=5857 RepID=A0A0D9QRC9_PLAFR|nr:uncharacterized protein AK88_02178 [Plasmodium fragile]KJP88231.1 hypothetical protein AK88_02178 [Plasmodium fragile]